MKSLFAALLLLLAFHSAQATTPIRGFGDVGYTMNDDDGATSDNFYHGALDIFLTNSLSEKVTYLAEVVFEMDNNEAIIDIERVIAQYHFSPWFKLGVGRFHTALGYWNDNYHHGTWLQTSVGRPIMYSFEDDDGILPMHSTGIEIRGEGDTGPGKLGYIANYANGRGPNVDPPQVTSDADKTKAINLLLYYTLPQFDELRFGVTYYKDTLPGCYYDSAATELVCLPRTNSSVDSFKNEGDEDISGGHIYWAPGKLELIAEYLVMKHAYSNGNTVSPTAKDTSVTGAYVQAAYDVGHGYTPYIRLDSVEVADDKKDDYTNQEGQKTGSTVGVRYDFDPANALKAEYQNIKHEIASSPDKTYNYTRLNWSFSW